MIREMFLDPDTLIVNNVASFLTATIAVFIISSVGAYQSDYRKVDHVSGLLSKRAAWVAILLAVPFPAHSVVGTLEATFFGLRSARIRLTNGTAS